MPASTDGLLGPDLSLFLTLDNPNYHSEQIREVEVPHWIKGANIHG